MFDKTFVHFIEKTVQTKSRSDAIKILSSTYYPYTETKITRAEAEQYYYLYKSDEKPIPMDKMYLSNKTKQNNYAKGYTLKGY
jgi:hypothetical protein